MSEEQGERIIELLEKILENVDATASSTSGTETNTSNIPINTYDLDDIHSQLKNTIQLLERIEDNTNR